MTEITEDLIRRQIAPRDVFTGGLVLATALASGMPPWLESTPTEQSINVSLISIVLLDKRAADRITQRARSIAENPLLRDEDEQSPPIEVLEKFDYMVQQVASLMRTPMLPGQVTSFDGELNVTWKAGGKIVSLACFPNNACVVQFGSLDLPPGSFQSEPNPTPDFVASKLDSLMNEDDVEGPPFPG